MLGGLRPGWFVDAGTRAPRGFAPGYDPAALQAAPGPSHSGPGARLVGRMPLRPGVSPPRVSPWAMVHRAYSPAGYVPFGPCGPVGLLVRVPVRPGVSPPGVSPPRVSPWAMVHRAYSPAGYVHSGPFGYPAKFAGVRRRPGQIRRRPQTPRGVGNLETTCLGLSEASDSLKQLV